MKQIGLILLGVAMCLPVAAQENALWRDAFTAGVNCSFNVRSIKELNYNGVAVSGGYRKFLYWGLFVMPEVSLYWQKYDYDDAPPGGSLSTYELNRFGIGADALLGLRIPVTNKIGIDLMAGPYIDWSFINKSDDNFYGEYDNFEVRGRLGVGLSVVDKILVTVFYDAAKTKFLSGNTYHRNRGNIVTVGVGYTF